MDARGSIIQVRDLVKYYHEEPVLKGVSVNIDEGDLVSIIGPSGCGKSTFLRCLNGMDSLDKGYIQIDGIVLERKSPRVSLGSDFLHKTHDLRQHIGMVFQSFNLFHTRPYCKMSCWRP